MPSSGQERFIVIEGLDGTGTTTLTQALAEVLRARDLRVRTTAEPSDGAFGSLLRQHLAQQVTLDPATAALVFTADRADHLDAFIRPALLRGDYVLCDRYLLSTLAYQGAEGVDREALLAASSAFDVPGVTFVLTAPEATRQQRLASRTGRERYEDPALAERLALSYEESIELLRRHGHRIEVVDASPAVDEVLTDLLARLDSGG